MHRHDLFQLMPSLSEGNNGVWDILINTAAVEEVTIGASAGGDPVSLATLLQQAQQRRG